MDDDAPPSCLRTARELPGNREDMAIFDDLPPDMRRFLTSHPRHIPARLARSACRFCRGDVRLAIDYLKALTA
jgi:hypothetical protein